MSEETSRICISCKKSVKIDTHFLDGATEFIGSPGYGSGFDSITQEKSADWPETPDWEPGERLTHSGRRLSIVICDNCLASEAAPFITVTHTYTLGRDLVSTTPWSESDHPQRWLDYHAKKAAEKAAEPDVVHIMLDRMANARTLCGLDDGAYAPMPGPLFVDAVQAHEGKATCDTCLEEWDGMK